MYLHLTNLKWKGLFCPRFNFTLSLIFSIFFLFTAGQLFAQTPVVTVRFANPQHDCIDQEYCLDVEFQSDTPGQEIFGMNVRFFYDDSVLDLIDFRDFQGGYAGFTPNPPLVSTGNPSSGPDLFNFVGAAEFVNGAIQKVDNGATPIIVPTDDWAKLYQVCFDVIDPNADRDNFCPSVVWDLEEDPSMGGILTGDDGVVITVVNPDPNEDSSPVMENVVQFNWAYDGVPDPPLGAPQEDQCISIRCIDLSLDKSVDDAAPPIGGQVVFTINVENLGPDAATNVEVSDLLPDGFTYVGHSGPVNAYNAITGVWDIPTIGAGSTASINITATVNPSGAYVNLAEVSDTNGADPDSTPGNGVDTDGDSDVEDDLGDEDDGDGVVVVPFIEGNLSVIKTDVLDLGVDGNLNAGDVINYTITVSNIGNVSVSNISISDPNATNISCSPTEPYILAPGESAVCTAQHIITQADINAGLVSNTATAIGEGPGGFVIEDSDDPDDFENVDPDGDGDPDDPTDTPLAQTAELQVEKTDILADGGDGVQPGDIINYIITVSNTGNVSVSDITINDSNATNISCSPASPYTLAPGESAVCTAQHLITQADIDAGLVSNTAVAVGQDPQGNFVIDNSDDPDDPTNSDPDGDGEPDDPTNTILQQFGELQVQKTGLLIDGGDGVQVGDIIDYTIAITNTGQATISNIVISDPNISGLGCMPGQPFTLAINQTATCMGQYVITQVDIDAGQVINTATASGQDPGGNPVSDTSDDPNDPTDLDPDGDGEPDDPTLILLPQMPALQVEKTDVLVDGGDGVQPGDYIDYTITVTNTGNVSVSNITISDPNATNIDCSPTQPYILTPGQSAVCTARHVLTQSDINAGLVLNTATANGQDPNGAPVSDDSDDPDDFTNIDPDGDGEPDDPTTTTIQQPGELQIEKTDILADGGDGVHVGDFIDYAITVTNTGNVTVSNIVINDLNASDLSCSPTEPYSLTPGESSFCTARHVITQSDIDAGLVSNTATVSGQTPNGAPVVDDSDDPDNPTNVDPDGDGEPDDPTVTPLQWIPALQLEKTDVLVDGGDGVQPGDYIDYTITVTNTGNISVSGITISDPNATNLSCSPAVPYTLAPGESAVCTAQHVLTQSDIDAGFVANTATANGQDPNGVPVTDDSDDPDNPTNVDPDGDGEPDDPTDTALLPSPALQVEKTDALVDGGDGIQAGDYIDYTITVTNTGNVSVSNITISDPNATNIDCSPTQPYILAPGQSAVCTARHVLTQSDINAGLVINTATANGQDPNGAPVSDDSDDPDDFTNIDPDGDGEPDDPTTTTLQQPGELQVEKTDALFDGGDGVQPGDYIDYTITVTNTGNVSVSNIAISDANATNINCSPIQPYILAPGQSAVCTARHVLTQSDIDAGFVANTATANGQTSNGAPVADDSDDPNDPTNVDPDGDGDPDDPTITPLQWTPALQVEKTDVLVDGGDGVHVGDYIDYTITVTNTGNVTVSNIIINDPNASNLSCSLAEPYTLTPGESAVCTARHEITESDIITTSVINIAIANGQDPSGTPVTDESDDPDDPTNNDPDGDGEPDDPTTTPIPLRAELQVEKTSELLGVGNDIQVGDVIAYTITVTNTSNVTVSNIIISDPNASNLSCIPTAPLTLNPGESTICTAEHVLTQSDINLGEVINTATATGQDPGGNIVSDISDDPNDPTNIDPDQDGEPDDPTITILSPASLCLEPVDDYVEVIDETTVLIEWRSQNGPISDHCWNLEIGAVNFDCGEGEAIVSAVLCYNGSTGEWMIDNPFVTIQDFSISGGVRVRVTGLQPGTTYSWSLVETCDGIDQGNSGPCTTGYFGPFITYDSPFVLASYNIISPSCPEVSPGYVTSGSFDVIITDPTTCSGTTYSIEVTPVPGSSPLGNTPPPVSPSYIGHVTGGQGTFNGAGAGQYKVVVYETGPCNPASTREELIVNVPDGSDSGTALWYIYDILGNIVADNDPQTIPGNDATLSDWTLPEGECSYQELLFAQGWDNCDGRIYPLEAVMAEPSTLPVVIDPGTQVEVTNNDNGWFELDIQWSAGSSVIVFTMKDAATIAGFSDNTVSLTISRTVTESVDATIVAAPINLLIPVCQMTKTIVYGFSIVDACDDEIDPAEVSIAAIGQNVSGIVAGYADPADGYFEYEVTFSGPGSGNFDIYYTDDFGNVFNLQPEFTVMQAAEDLAPRIDAPGDLTDHVPACEQTAYICKSFQVWDDCDDIVLSDVNFDDGGAQMSLVQTIVDNNNNSIYFEYCGDLHVGVYLMSVEYQGTVASWIVNLSQDINQAPDIQVPGNLNFTLPVCTADLTAAFAVQIDDDCDDNSRIAQMATFTLGGETITPVLINDADNQSVYFEFEAILSEDVVLTASYTDSGGATSSVSSLFNVTAQPDNWAPIIVYPSQNIYVDLDPCDPGVTTVFFEVTAIDNCDDVTAVVSVDSGVGMLFPTEGNSYAVELSPGTYTVHVSATDSSQNSRTEDFQIIVTQGPTPVTNLACNDNVNVTLNDACQVLIVPDMVLEGAFGCLLDEDFEVLIHDGVLSNGNIVDGCGEFIYEVTLAEGADQTTNFSTCWGYIRAEDKADPIIECPDDTDQVQGFDLLCDDINKILLDDPLAYVVDAAGNYLYTVEGNYSLLLYTGVPLVTDNCGNILIRVTDEVNYFEECEGVVITRTFYAEDRYNSACNNMSRTALCTQEISFRKADFSDVIDIPLTVELNCDDPLDTDANGYPSTSETGVPSIRTAFGLEDIDLTYCNLVASYEDGQKVETCGGSFRFIRTWTIVDWCNINAPMIIAQVIKVEDSTAPTLSCPQMDYDWDGVSDPIIYSIGPFNCSAAFQIPGPAYVNDNCSGFDVVVDIVTDVTHDVTDIYGNPTGETWTEEVFLVEGVSVGTYVSDIAAGCYRFRYTATDDCGNATSIDCDFCVEDQVEPIAICSDELHISIGGEGVARIFAEDVDGGSHDNCGDIVSMKVRRGPYGQWKDYIDFDCDDITSQITIELKVWDAAGNTNTCMLDVVVEDNVQPYCIAPHDVVIGCDELPWDFDAGNREMLQDLFGEAMAVDNCDVDWEELNPLPNLNCGSGTIIRRFRATDEHGNVSGNNCLQVITINVVNNYEIYFPADAQANCGIPNPDTLVYNELGCDLLAVSVDDEIYTASSDECYKIFRTYRVINWCEYDGSSAPVVVGRDQDCDGFPGDEGVWVMVRGNGVTYYDKDNDESNANPVTGNNLCTYSNSPHGHWANSSNVPQITSNGYWEYTQIIKVYDDEDPVISFGATDPFCSIDNVDCDAEVSVSFSVEEACTPDDVTVVVFVDIYADGVLDGEVAGELSGTYPDYTLTGTYPLGNHRYEVKVYDGCGNGTVVYIPFSVVDCKAPTPICISGLAIELMPVEAETDVDGDGDFDTGAMSFAACDFIVDCSGYSDCNDPIRFSISRDHAVEDGTEIPSPDQSGMVVTCEDLGLLMIRIYAWDSAYNPYALQPDGSIGGPNYDYCVTYVEVQDNLSGVCSGTTGSGNIAGGINTEQNVPVEAVFVELSGQQSLDIVTDSDGLYEFGDLQTVYDYSITPQSDVHPMNGVSTLDLIKISKHILGVESLDSPYKLIAADVNNSENISTLDLISLRRMILGLNTEFANNTSWRFVDADYEFPNPANPWLEDFPEVISVNDLGSSIVDQNFVGIKIGDVNDSAVANSFTSVDDRNSGDMFFFNVEHCKMKSGNTYWVDFRAADIEDILGYQATFTFDTDLINLVDIKYAAATEENFGLRFIDEGMITTSWHLTEEEEEPIKEQVLFSLQFKALADVNLSQVLGVSSAYTVAEAYKFNEETMDIALDFLYGHRVEENYDLYQNRPNPFKNKTIIGFNLPKPETVTLRIHDINGNILKLVEGAYPGGYNEFVIRTDGLAAGSYYYTLESGDFVATKKLIVLE